jgi:hypothetical protein
VQKQPSPQPTLLRKQPAALLILGLLIAGIIHGLSQILELAQAHWLEPNLFGDSFAFVQREGSGHPLGWLLAQHNEHRIVWAKAISLVETSVFKLPPGQSALYQNLALILGCAGLWCWLSQRLLQRPDLRLITALAGWLLLVNPWQYENLGWEFQTPWFLINALVLAGALLLSSPAHGASLPSQRQTELLAGLLPWVALTSTGQGLAVVVAFSICACLHSRRLGVLVCSSTILAIVSFFVLLPYSKPTGHPELSFQLGYFLRAWLGGPWQGLALLTLVISAVLVARRRSIPREIWPALLMPGLFSLLFAGMITLSRSGFGLEQAQSSRYITHSLMLGLCALMALALIDDHNARQTTPLLGGFLVLVATLGSLPQGLQASGMSYAGAWTEGQRWAQAKRNRFLCHAQQASLATRGIRLLKPCGEIHPDLSQVEHYFQGQSPVEPLGWHRDLLEPATPAKRSSIRHQLDRHSLSTDSIQVQGWAFLSRDPRQSLLVVGDYGISKQLGSPLDEPRRDVKRAHQLPHQHVGFKAVFPKTYKGQPLRAILIVGPNQFVQIWEDPSANG